MTRHQPRAEQTFAPQCRQRSHRPISLNDLDGANDAQNLTAMLRDQRTGPL
jgi:hypothetical protein